MHLREGDADHPPLSAASAGRAVVAVRGFHRFAVRDGLTAGRPGGRRTTAGAGQAAAEGAAGRRTSSGSSTRPGPRARRWRCATGRCSSCSTRCGARISEAVGLDVDDLDLDDRACCCAARAARSASCRSGPWRARRSRPTWSAGGPRSPPPAPGDGGAVPQRPRRTAVAAERLDGAGPGGRAGRGHRRGLAAHAAALVRHPPDRRRRRRPGRPGAARPRLGDDHAGLHAGHRRQPARGLRHRPPARPRADGCRSDTPM